MEFWVLTHGAEDGASFGPIAINPNNVLYVMDNGDTCYVIMSTGVKLEINVTIESFLKAIGSKYQAVS